MKRSGKQLKELQGKSLDWKIQASLNAITGWYEHFDGRVYVSFSGGKDSTVLLHLVRRLYPDVEAVFSNTGLEYPEIVSFVKTFENVTTVRPEIPFRQVVEQYGWPVVSKVNANKLRKLQNPTARNRATRRLYLTGYRRDGRYDKDSLLPMRWRFLIKAPFRISERCCDFLKIKPINTYEKQSEKKAYIGTKAVDSRARERAYLKTACNAFDFPVEVSKPLSFWTNRDIWRYIERENLTYCEVYDQGVENTGCMFCCFGLDSEVRTNQPNRFQRMYRTHPKQWNYCINTLGLGEVLNFMGVEYGEHPFSSDESIERQRQYRFGMCA